MNWLEMILAAVGIYLAVGLVVFIAVAAVVVILFVKVWKGMSKADKQFDEMQKRHDGLWKNRR